MRYTFHNSEARARAIAAQCSLDDSEWTYTATPVENSPGLWVVTVKDQDGHIVGCI